MALTNREKELIELAKSNHLSYEDHCELLENLKKVEFASEYYKRMELHFDKSLGAYIPLIIFIILIITGLVLIFK